MAQLDAIKDIAAKIRAEKAIKMLTVAGSVAYVTDHAGELARFQYLDDLAEELIRDEVDENVRAISFHLENVRNALARELWQQGLGVGPYTLDELLFDAVKSGDLNPVVSVLARLRRSEKNVLFALGTGEEEDLVNQAIDASSERFRCRNSRRHSSIPIFPGRPSSRSRRSRR